MKFCSEEQEKNKTIKNIQIEGNKYIINYFNNNKIYKNNFIEDKNHLEDLMIKQAQERDELEYLTTQINRWGSIVTWIFTNYLIGKSMENDLIFLAFCYFILSVTLLFKHKKYKIRLNELKKYRILLDNYEKIKENPDFYKTIKLNKYKYFLEKQNEIRKIMLKSQKDENIDIFNIDEFNLNDMKIIKKELKKKNIV